MKKIMRFAVVGGFTTAIDWLIYWGLSIYINVTISKICSMLIASVFSYAVNKFWTFDNSDKKHTRYIWKYYVTFVINVAINTSINTLVFTYTGQKLIALVLATTCGTLVNYLLQNFWVFKKEEE